MCKKTLAIVLVFFYVRKKMNSSIKNITQQVDSYLDSYATEFHGLVNAYARASHGKHSCEFFINPASLIEGYWVITPHKINHFQSVKCLTGWRRLIYKTHQRLKKRLKLGTHG